LWGEHKGKATAESVFKLHLAREAGDALWAYAPGNAKPADLFNESVYTRGAMTLHALRQRIGDETFFRLLKDWSAQNAHGHVTTPRFVELAEQLSGKQLDQLFDVWLYQAKKPTKW
jgi:aminopeptidase N